MSEPSELPVPLRPVDGRVFGEVEALAIWARAATLQAEATRDAAMRFGVEPPEPTAISTGGALAIDPATRAPAGMYLASEVLAAALEAGIPRDCVMIAIAEHEAVGGEAALALDAVDARARARLVGHEATSVRAEAVLPESPTTVLARLRSVAASAPYDFTFDATVGGHPVEGGVLRFRNLSYAERVDIERHRRGVNWFAYHTTRMQLQHVHVTLALRGTAEAPGCEVVVTGDLRPGQRWNVRFFRGMGTALTALFGVAGAAVAAKLVGGATAGALGAALGVAAGVGYNALLAAVSRWEHRAARRAIERAFGELLRAVQRPGDEARAFAPPAAAAPPRLVSGEDGAPLRIGRAPLAV
jgi:hypothetical protein